MQQAIVDPKRNSFGFVKLFPAASAWLALNPFTTNYSLIGIYEALTSRCRPSLFMIKVGFGLNLVSFRKLTKNQEKNFLWLKIFPREFRRKFFHIFFVSRKELKFRTRPKKPRDRVWADSPNHEKPVEEIHNCRHKPYWQIKKKGLRNHFDCFQENLGSIPGFRYFFSTEKGLREIKSECNSAALQGYNITGCDVRTFILA